MHLLYEKQRNKNDSIKKSDDGKKKKMENGLQISLNVTVRCHKGTETHPEESYFLLSICS